MECHQAAPRDRWFGFKNPVGIEPLQEKPVEPKAK